MWIGYQAKLVVAQCLRLCATNQNVVSLNPSTTKLPLSKALNLHLLNSVTLDKSVCQLSKGKFKTSPRFYAFYVWTVTLPSAVSSLTLRDMYYYHTTGVCPHCSL